MNAKILLAGLVAVVCGSASLSHAKEPEAPSASRFLIIPSKYVNRSGTEVPIVIKLDTVTGESWRLVEHHTAPDSKEYVTYWAPVPTAPELVRMTDVEIPKESPEESARRMKDALETARKFMEKSK